MVQPVIMERLRNHLATDDPWRLDSNPFDQQRYRLMARMIDRVSDGMIGEALEVGCAAGSFTRHLAERCRHVTVLDVLPQALERCRARMHMYRQLNYVVADISETDQFDRDFDLVVFAEVLCYLLDRHSCTEAIRNVARAVRPGGCVIFCSGTDFTVKRWGYRFGAETGLAMLQEYLTVNEHYLCVGETPNECAMVARLTRVAATE